MDIIKFLFGRKSNTQSLLESIDNRDTIINQELEKIKNENRELKKRLKEIGKEMDNQITELSKPCAITPKNINNASPVSGNITDISEAYNRSANTERLTYKQKLEMIKLVHQKGTIKD